MAQCNKVQLDFSTLNLLAETCMHFKVSISFFYSHSSILKFKILALGDNYLSHGIRGLQYNSLKKNIVIKEYCET